MARRRRGGSDGLTVIYWRDIPAQVVATAGDVTAKAMLEPRFQHAIDRAAAIADLTETEAYVAQWRKAIEPFEGEPEAVVEATTKQLTESFPRERLEQLVAKGGANEASDQTDQDEESDR